MSDELYFKGVSGVPTFSSGFVQSGWARISEVATRLGVGPIKPDSAPTIIVCGADGQSYDVWEVAIAFLDAMEKKT